MADDPKSRGFTTVYEEQGAGALAFDGREDILTELVGFLGIIDQLKIDFREQQEIVAGLHEVELQLNALRISTENAEDVKKKLASLVAIPIGEGKTLRLDAFRRTSSRETPATDEAYREHVKKLVRNTVGNITHLLLTWPEDTELQNFLKELHGMEPGGSQMELKKSMGNLSKSPQLAHYNAKKAEFLVEWLRPFQDFFGKPVEELTEEELQATVTQVEALRGKKLEEMTHLKQDGERETFRQHNRRMHPIMNGKTTDFWGSGEVRAEFVALTSQLIARFSFTLEDRFLLFKTKDEGFAYLVGFADDAFEEVVELEDGRLGIFPHLKVFLKGSNGGYTEIIEKAYAGNRAAYFRALKTAVVPFLTSMAIMLEMVLSDEMKQAFNMWT